MNSFSIANYDLSKNYVIEASAGTGKTYNIVEIVSKLVNVYKVDLNKILIVTYTEKAAGELKSRIRSKLKNVDVDNAQIGTIHSFCQNVIKKYGVSANLPLKLSVVDDEELNKFSERYIRSDIILNEISYFLKEGIEIKINSLKETLVECVKKYYLDSNGHEVDSIISIHNLTKKKEEVINIKEKIENRKKWLFLNDLLANSNNFEEVLKNNQDINNHYHNLLNSKTSKCIEFAQELKNVYKEKFKFNGRKFSENNFVSLLQESKDIDAYNYFKDLNEYLKKEPKITYGSFKKLDKNIAAIYLKDFYMKWQEEKEKNKKQSFDDMIRCVREALFCSGTLLNKLKQDFKIAIIDEFQDTNQKQFDIFKSIFMTDNDILKEEDKHKIIVVGDPKQSIYSFQGADINVYYSAVEEIQKLDGEKCMLMKNYRSTSDMVKACNRLFQYYDFYRTTFTDCDFLCLENGDEKEHDVVFDNKKIKPFWLAVSSEDDMLIDPAQFAKIAVQQIIECCSLDENGKTRLQLIEKVRKDGVEKTNYRNVSFKDFTVLVKSRSESMHMVRALKNAGIPFIKYKDDELFLGKECAHWIAILEAIDADDFTLNNRKKFKKALFTIFFGKTIKQVKNNYYDRDDISEVETFKKWKQYALLRKWEILFEDILSNSKLRENTKTLKEIQTLAIVKQISNYCIDYLTNGKSLTDLIRNLKNLAKGNSDDTDDLNSTIVEKSTDFNCVQIMTMHISKGLQFPVVIAAGGYKKPNNRGKVFTSHEMDEVTNNEKQYLVFSKNKEEETEEWKRLFYVAYTRAQHLLIIPNYRVFGQDFLYDSINSLMAYNKDVIKFINDSGVSFNYLRNKSTEILGKNVSLENDEDLKDKQNQILKILKDESFKKKINKRSYSSLSHGLSVEMIEDDFDNKEGQIDEGLSIFDTNSKAISANYDESKQPISLANDYPKGARLGTAIHEVFETIDFNNYQNNIDFIIKNCFLKQGVIVKDEWLESTKEIIKNVIEADIPIINGAKFIVKTLKLKNITLDNRKDEMEFNFNAVSEKLKDYCNGFVDLIFKNGNYYSIVDWKSDILKADFDSYSNLDSLKKHVDNCYSIQRVLYSYCLIKWIKLYNKHLTEQEIFKKHFGGIYYIFIRGCIANTGNGIYCQTWDSYADLENAYNEIIKNKIGGN